MTWNEYHQRVWRAAGLSDEQLAIMKAHNAREMELGRGEMKAVLKPGQTEEQAVADGVLVFKAFHSAPLWVKQVVIDAMDAEIERENQKN